MRPGSGPLETCQLLNWLVLQCQWYVSSEAVCFLWRHLRNAINYGATAKAYRQGHNVRVGKLI